MYPGAIEGLIAGAVICGVITVVMVKVNKKDKIKTDEVLNSYPQEITNSLRNVSFTPAEGKDMYMSKGLVIGVTPKNESKSKVSLMFYAPEHEDYYTKDVTMSNADIQAKGIAPQTFVDTLMKYDKEMHFFYFKKIV